MPDRIERPGATHGVMHGWVTAFLDIVGLRRALGELDGPVRTAADEAALALRMAEVAALLSDFRMAFDTFSAGAQSPAPRDARFNQLSAEEKQLYVESTTWRVERQAFGDSVLLHVPIRGVAGDARCVLDLFQMVGSLYLILLAHGIVIRGGIEIGRGSAVWPGEIVASSVPKAYELESKVAGYPRVVVGAGVREMLTALTGLAPTDFGARLNSGYARAALQFLWQDEDAEWVVDPLSGFVLGNVLKQYPNALERVRKFAAREHARFAAAADGKLERRYSRLLKLLGRDPVALEGQTPSPA